MQYFGSDGLGANNKMKEMTAAAAAAAVCVCVCVYLGVELTLLFDDIYALSPRHHLLISAVSWM